LRYADHVDRLRNREPSEASSTPIPLLSSGRARAARPASHPAGDRCNDGLDALLASPLLRLAAAWARQTARTECAAAVAWFDFEANRPLLHHAGTACRLPLELIAAVGALGSNGRSVTLPGSGRSFRLAEAAAKARIRAHAAVPFNAGGFHGCVIVATRAPRRFASSEVAALARVAACVRGVAEEWQRVLNGRRRAFARALHDGLAQTLTTLVFAIRDVEEDVRTPRERLRLRAARAHAARAVHDVRGILESFSLAIGTEAGAGAPRRRTAPR
jgi:signal transduction histidine kinase